MDDHDLAERLYAVVQPDGAGIRNAIDAGEDVAAVIDLVEQAALHQVSIPRDLITAVANLAAAGRPPLDDVDVASLREDIATLTRIAA